MNLRLGMILLFFLHLPWDDMVFVSFILLKEAPHFLFYPLNPLSASELLFCSQPFPFTDSAIEYL